MKNSNDKLKMIIKEIMEKELNFPYLIEGVDIDNINKTVSFNPTHEDNVNTSITLNPTYSNINGVDVISIFQRKDNADKNDGNPLIYALKNIKGWKFKNPQEDIVDLLRQFIRITEKIKPEYDTIITIPSSNVLNTHFLYRLNKIIKANVEIEDYLYKLSATDVWEEFIDWNQISTDFPDEKRFKNIEKSLNFSFKEMESDNSDIFSFKYIKNIGLRKYIKKTMFVKNSEPQIEYAPYINEKNILILDDTITTGNTISEACLDILEMFTPNSITVITLFSKL